MEERHFSEDHAACAELLGVYALDALEPDDMARVQAHLASCVECTAEVAEYHDVAALLAQTGGDAPAHLWDRIAKEAKFAHRGEDVAGIVDEQVHPKIASVSERRGAVLSDASSSLRPRGGVIRIRLPQAVLAVAAAVIVALLVLVAVDRPSPPSSSVGLAQLASAALSSPTASRFNLTDLHNARPKVDASVAVLPSGAAYLVNDRLPSLPSSRTYQLWGEDHGNLVSLGLLGNRPQTSAFHVDPAAQMRTFAITVEPAGGVTSPSSEPVAEGTAV